jgi:hypothetical protein
MFGLPGHLHRITNQNLPWKLVEFKKQVEKLFGRLEYQGLFGTDPKLVIKAQFLGQHTSMRFLS